MNLRPQYRDKNLLVTFAERGDIWAYREQHEAFSGMRDEMDAHDLVLLKFFAQKPSVIQDDILERGSYQEALDMFNVDEVNEFRMMLVTNDGQVLIDSEEPVGPEQIFRALERQDVEITPEGL